MLRLELCLVGVDAERALGGPSAGPRYFLNLSFFAAVYGGGWAEFIRLELCLVGVDAERALGGPSARPRYFLNLSFFAAVYGGGWAEIH